VGAPVNLASGALSRPAVQGLTSRALHLTACSAVCGQPCAGTACLLHGRMRFHSGPGLGCRSRLHIGLGRAAVSRADMFRQEAGVAVVLEQRVFRNPSCNGAPVRVRAWHSWVKVTLRISTGARFAVYGPGSGRGLDWGHRAAS